MGIGGDGSSNSAIDQIKSPVTFVGIVAIAMCSVVVIIFVTIFTVLQVSIIYIISNFELDAFTQPVHVY
jgi:hypothetical protein